MFSQIHHTSLIFHISGIDYLNINKRPMTCLLTWFSSLRPSALIGLRFSHAQVNICVQPSTVLFYYLTSAECVISVSLIATEEGIICALTETDINWMTYSAQRVSMQVPELFPEFYSYWYHAEVVCFYFLGFFFYHHSCLYSLIIVDFFFLKIPAKHIPPPICGVSSHVRHRPLCHSKPRNTISWTQ